MASIRPFTAADYNSISALLNAAEPEYPVTPERIQHDDEHRDPKCRWARFLLDAGGTLAGIGYYGQSSGHYHPREFHLGVTVLPEQRSRGFGTALYDHLQRMLAPFDPQTVRISVREDRPHSIRFLAQRGFNEMMREWESRLDVAAFDASPYVEAFDAPARHGVTIRTLAELQAIDPDWGPKCHALETELFRDVPSTNAPTEVPFEVWWDEVRSHPGMLPDAYFVAVHDGQYVGLSTLHRDCTGGYLDTGLTGVIRSYRRKGIALAMKLRAIEYAQAVGAPEIRTWNETGNTGMLSINVRLGFLRQPAWIEFAKTLAPS